MLAAAVVVVDELGGVDVLDVDGAALVVADGEGVAGPDAWEADPEEHAVRAPTSVAPTTSARDTGERSTARRYPSGMGATSDRVAPNERPNVALGGREQRRTTHDDADDDEPGVLPDERGDRAGDGHPDRPHHEGADDVEGVDP